MTRVYYVNVSHDEKQWHVVNCGVKLSNDCGCKIPERRMYLLKVKSLLNTTLRSSYLPTASTFT